MRFTFLFAIFVCGLSATAQTLAVNNVKATQTGGVATVSYDLVGPAGSTYFVKLLYSTDGGNLFSNELTYVNGDVNGNITPGMGKKITWNSNQEAGGLAGNVIFKVAAESKLKLPPPLKNENARIDFLDIVRNGTTLVLKFKLTILRDGFYEIPSYATHIIDNLGSKVFLENSPRFELVAGLSVTSDLVFEGVDFAASSIALLQINGFGSIFQIRNIVLPKE